MTSFFHIIKNDIHKIFSKIYGFFDRSDSLMSKETIELLSNPETRKDFIEFTSGKNENLENKNNQRSKKFILKNGEEITVVTYS